MSLSENLGGCCKTHKQNPEKSLQYDVTERVPVAGLGSSPVGDLDKAAVFNTDIKTKQMYFSKFAELISNQFLHGGDKYKLKGFEDREATDIISSVFGGESEFDWILGTMMKYLFRFKNFNREKDLLKIATYCYLLWLKQGNHLHLEHDEDVSK
jgi:hypothetical protein